jgi:hypothetical protein
MTYIYYIDGKKYTTDNDNKITKYKISSPNEQTPAYENLTTGFKLWLKKGWHWHRLTGPAIVWSDGKNFFCLNGKRYENILYWLKDHPNQDNSFQIEMLLKYS